MRIKLNQQEQEEVQKFLLTQETNIKEAELFNDYLNKKDTKSSLAASYLVESKHESNLEAFSTTFAKLTKSEKEKVPLVKELDPRPYLEDDFIKNIHLKNEKRKDWEIVNSAYLPYEGFVYDELDIDKHNHYREITPFGFFVNPFPYILIKQHGQTWMSLTPHEINTMREDVNRAHGHVVTLGLGLGYYAYMASLKEDVKDVTVIEIDPNVIALFNEYILPQFPRPEKVKVIQKDAISFSKSLKDGDYDYLFADIWHLPEDGLSLYLNLKHYLVKFKQTEVSYWIEKSILSLLRRGVIFLLDEEIHGSQDEDYDFAATSSDCLINALHFALKKVSLTSLKDVTSLLSDEYLKTLDLKF
jgi:hypothetical protein